MITLAFQRPTLAAFALVLGGFLLGSAVPATGEVVYTERFEQPVQGQSPAAGPDAGSVAFTRSEVTFQVNSASVAARSVRFGTAGKGTISFDLQRRADAPGAQRGTVFTLGDPLQPQAPFYLQVQWESGFDPKRPAIYLEGRRFFDMGLGLWSPTILLDRAVQTGQWIHVDLTWDDEGRKYGLFIDGRPQDTRPFFYRSDTKEVIPDTRLVLNDEHRRLGLPLGYEARPFGDLLRGVVSVSIGAHTETDRTEIAFTPLSNAVLDNFVIVVDEPLEELYTAKHDVKGLTGAWTTAGALLAWAPPEIHGMDQQYAVYRRAGGETGSRFERLTTSPLRGLSYVDKSAVPGQVYRYSVVSVYGDLKGGSLEGKYPPEVTVGAMPVAIESVSTERLVYGAGQQIVVTLRGTPELTATFSVGDIARDAAMEEVSSGIFVGTVAVPAKAYLAGIPVTGVLQGGAGKITRSGSAIDIDTVPPEPVDRIIGGTAWVGENPIHWDPSPSKDVAEYRVYRGEGKPPVVLGQGYSTVPATAKSLEFVDTRVVPGLEYQYTVVAVDKAGNAGSQSPIVKLKAVAGDGPKITSITAEPSTRVVKPGHTARFSVTGESGAAVKVDLGTLASGIVLTEQGRTGRYLGAYTVADKDVAPAKTLHRVVAHLEDAFGSSALAGPEVAVVGLDALNDTTPPVISKTSHDGWKTAGLSGRLVAGDVVTVMLEGDPAGYASFELSEVAGRVSMVETSPGVYSGFFTVPQGAAGSAVPITAYLADEAGNETAVVAERTLAFDTRLRLTVTAKDKLLPADRTSQTTLTAKATDANGKPLQGRELALTLSTTEEYTGVVGGGAVGGQFASTDDVDNVEVRWGGKTDSFGEVSATYTAGFAAKTALLVAKDLATGDVGAGWLNTYVASTVAIELTPATRKGAASKAILRITADPPKLTADGRSTSRIKVWVTDLANAPLAGAKVSFGLAGSNGSLRMLQGTTDIKGIATAEYRAGTAIGTVTITAASLDYGAAGSVQIILMSDAPAKVDLVASAKSLVADSSSKATLSVRVSDIHDNPNDQVPVTFSLLQGAGTFSASSLLTDRNGEGAVTFTAGRTAGTAIIEARHTSRAPTEAELRRIFGTLFVPRWYDRQERDRVTVVDWLVKPGDKVTKGMALVTLDTRTGTRTLVAPADGIFVREVKHERDPVELGDTVGYVEIDPVVWKADYAK